MYLYSDAEQKNIKFKAQKSSEGMSKSDKYLKDSIGKLINPVPPNKSIINTKTTNNSKCEINVEQQFKGRSMDNTINFLNFQEINESFSNKSTDNQTLNHCVQSPKQLECRQFYFKNIPDPVNPTLQTSIKYYMVEEKQINPKYMKIQNQITERMRYQTIDWLYSLSVEIDIKRETIHLAINYLDNYLNIKIIKKNELQLVAISAFILAFKLEQKIPVNFIEIFQSNQARGFSKQKILEMEFNIFSALKFKLRKITFSFWIDNFTYEWDHFIGQTKILSLTIIQENIILMSHSLKFRNSKSIHMFANLVQLVETAIYNLEVYTYERWKIVMSGIYLIARLQVESIIEDVQNIYKLYYEKYKKNTNPIFLDKYGFNELFSEFLLGYNLELSDIIAANKFIAQYLDLNFKKINSEIFENNNIENIIYTHVYDDNTLYYITTKL